LNLNIETLFKIADAEKPELGPLCHILPGAVLRQNPVNLYLQRSYISLN